MIEFIILIGVIFTYYEVIKGRQDTIDTFNKVLKIKEDIIESQKQLLEKLNK